MAWTQQFSTSKNKTYYWNTQTKTASWTQPDDGIPCSPPDSPHSPSSQDSKKPQQNNKKPNHRRIKDSSDTDSQNGGSGSDSEEDHDKKPHKKKIASTGTKTTHAHKRKGIVCGICHQNTTDFPECTNKRCVDLPPGGTDFESVEAKCPLFQNGNFVKFRQIHPETNKARKKHDKAEEDKRIATEKKLICNRQ